MRTPITYYGGKQMLAKTIIDMIPEHRIYCEPFFGGGAVFFAKESSRLEVINDTNDRLIAFYEQCQTNFDTLAQMVINSLHSEKLYNRARDIYNQRVPYTDVEMAWSFWVMTNCSFASSTKGSWRWDNATSGSHAAIGLKNKRKEFNDTLRERLSEVQISCRDALEVITKRDKTDTFFYIDPPYPGACQGHYRGYSMKDFAMLLDVLSNIKGKFILSNYWSQTLRFYVAKNGWNVQKIKLQLKTANFNDGKGKRYKEEIIISNFSKDNTKTLF